MKKGIFKIALIAFFVMGFCTFASSQTLISGYYGNGLSLAYNPASKQISGYFENYTGLDNNGESVFSCIFYFKEALTGSKIHITSFYPADSAGSLVKGTLEIVNETNVKILLDENPGGCWNVQDFDKTPISFSLEKKMPWLYISYITASKVYLKNATNASANKNVYLRKGDLVFVSRVKNNYAYCTYYGKKKMSGLIKLDALNR